VADDRKEEGLAVGAFLTGIIAGALTSARREHLLKIDVLAAEPDGDGWIIDTRTNAGFGYTIRVDLTET
jgi:hypothetical protein